MKRVLVLAVATIGLVLPAAANAGAFQGVVIAKNPKRKAIVTASANGTVRTVRAPKAIPRSASALSSQSVRASCPTEPSPRSERSRSAASSTPAYERRS